LRKCGEAQAGTPAQRSADVVRWAASLEQILILKMYCNENFEPQFNYK